MSHCVLSKNFLSAMIYDWHGYVCQQNDTRKCNSEYHHGKQTCSTFSGFLNVECVVCVLHGFKECCALFVVYRVINESGVVSSVPTVDFCSVLIASLIRFRVIFFCKYIKVKQQIKTNTLFLDFFFEVSNHIVND